MAIDLTKKYPGRVNPVTEQYPFGSFKNRSAPGSTDGTYLEQDWKNCEWGFLTKLLVEAGMTPNDSIDNAQSSQFYDALMKVVSTRIESTPLIPYGVTTGSGNQMSVTCNGKVAFKDGQRITVRACGKNTSKAPTINVNSLGAKAIVKGANNQLAVGDIIGAGGMLDLIYDTRYDRWVLLNPAVGVSVTGTLPVGSYVFMAYDGNDLGEYLFANGRAVSRTQYPELFAKIGTTYGQGDGNTTFNLPDLRGAFLRGLDKGKGRDPNRKLGVAQGDAIRNIKGTFKSDTKDGAYATDPFYWIRPDNNGAEGNAANYGKASLYGFDASKVVPTANENRPYNHASVIYIKAL